MRVFVVGLFLSLGASGCDRFAASDPVGAYQSFTRALERGEPKAAFKVLSKRTQQRLTEQAAAASKASGGAIKADVAELTFPMLGRPGNVTEVKLLRRENDRAVLQVTADGRPQELTMVLEDGAWRIDA